MKELMKIWKESVGWKNFTNRQKKIVVALGSCLALTFVFIWSVVSIPFGIASVILYCMAVREGVTIEE